MKRNLPEYVEYRNTIRGHYALKSKPSDTRLDEQDFFALPYILNCLEKFAWCERSTKKVGFNGLMHFFQRDVYINPKLAGQKIKLFETLDGLETEDKKGRLYFLPDYKERICRPFWQLNARFWRDDSRVYYFRAIRQSKRLVVANQMLRIETGNNSVESFSSTGEIVYI